MVEVTSSPSVMTGNCVGVYARVCGGTGGEGGGVVLYLKYNEKYINQVE